jgi:hypothetical protein
MMMIAPIALHRTRVVGYASLSVTYKEGWSPSSGAIIRLMTMMVVICFL